MYRIEFRAVHGIVTRKDAKVLLKKYWGEKNCRNVFESFDSKEEAEFYLSDKCWEFGKKLSKSYEVRLCTEAQYIDGHFDLNGNVYVVDFTQMQNDDMYLIGD